MRWLDAFLSYFVTRKLKHFTTNSNKTLLSKLYRELPFGDYFKLLFIQLNFNKNSDL